MSLNGVLCCIFGWPIGMECVIMYIFCMVLLYSNTLYYRKVTYYRKQVCCILFSCNIRPIWYLLKINQVI